VASLEGALAPDAETSGRLPLSAILTYCLPTVGCGFMFLLIGLYLMKFATDVLLIAPAAMGTIFGLSRIWDAISDPIAGYLSDRTRHRSGRRRPWIFASLLPIGLSYWMLWSPPDSLAGDALTAWMAVGIFGFYSATTIFLIPHLSLGAELSSDYHERSRIFGIRHIAWTVGSMLALVAMAVLIQSEAVSAAASRDRAAQLGLAVAVVTALLVGVAALRLRERPEFQGRGPRRPLAAFADVWKNPHARLLLLVTFVENLGAATIGILTLYVAQYIVGNANLAPVFILCYMIPSVASVPLWIRVSRRIGKKQLWTSAMVMTAFAFGGMFFLDEGDYLLISLLAVAAGLAAGAGATIGPSIQADVIDYDEYRTGERKEGAYFAAWNFVFKAAYGVTLMTTGYVLQFSGFEPNAVQSEEVKLALRSLFGAFPFACYLGGALVFSRFRLGEREYESIRTELDRRRATGRSTPIAPPPPSAGEAELLARARDLPV
jgi:GPH family glycoside/pentoside/hexuronide:cation symporter